jgi:FkbM family methyltransferase
MFNRISVLKTKGYYPDLILDIGAYKGYWTESMMCIYNDVQYMLFEAIKYDELNRFDSCHNIKNFNVLLNDKHSEVDWYEMKNTGDSMFKELTYHFTNCVPKKITSIDLDSFLDNKNITEFSKIFIKIDCQGAEIPILKGASNILKKTDFIILEMPLFGKYNTGVPTFLEHIEYMDQIGFVPYDLLDNHYINDFNMQVDMMFINKKHPLNTLVNKLLLS